MKLLSFAILALGLIVAASVAEAARKQPGLTCTAKQLSTPDAQTCTAVGATEKKEGKTRVHTVICLEHGEMMCCVPNADDDGWSCSSHMWWEIRPSGNLPQLQVQPQGGQPPQLHLSPGGQLQRQ
jgi:hypothetical protein